MTLTVDRPVVSRQPTGARATLPLALALVAVAVLVRGAIAATGDFYWDDLILIARGSAYPLFSAELLGYDHDGHLMPAAFFVAGLSTRLAPLEWWLPAVTLIVAQLAAALAVLRLLRSLLGSRPVQLVPLAVFLFAPLTLPSFAWWAAGLNSLPLQFALAWVAADAVALCRTGRVRFAVSGVVVLASALAFFEKSVLVPVVAVWVVSAVYRLEGRPVRSVWRDGRTLWAGSAVVLGVWAVCYLMLVDGRFGWQGLATAGEMVWHATALGLIPALAGGPWTWERWPPSPPWADPPAAGVVIAWLAVAGFVVAVLWWKRRTGIVWAGVVGYVGACLVAMVVTRSSIETAIELGQTLRYVADVSVVVAIAIALIVRAPDRRPPPRVRPVLVVGLVAVFVTAFVASSVWSAVTFARSWRDNPTAAYLANAKQALASDRDTPMLDQPVSLYVLLPFAYPYNLASRVFNGLAERPEFADSTPDLRVLDDDGTMIGAQVTWNRAIPQGPEPNCGFRVDGETVLPLTGPLMAYDWTAQINYLANIDGMLEVGLGHETPVEVPMKAGLHTVFVRLTGDGASLYLRPTTPGLSPCVGAGPVGAVVPDR
ncbi:MAG TPA: hypothetical protein VIW24_20920 [Aldersonia sp.]